MFGLLLTLVTYSATPQPQNVDIHDSVETTQVGESYEKAAGGSSGITPQPTLGSGTTGPKK